MREDLDEDEAYMVLATANAQGELSPLEIGCHAHGLRHGSAKDYAVAIGKSAAFVSQVKSGFEVAKLSQLNFQQLQSKTQHLAAIHKLPEEAWSVAVEAMLADEWSAKETSEKVVEALEAKTKRRQLALLVGENSAREFVQEQRYLIWKYCHENSAAWQSEKARIAEEANRKRSEAAKAQPRSEDGTKLAAKEPEPAQEEFSAEPPAETVEQVVEQTVPAPDNSDKAKKSKASKSKTNRGGLVNRSRVAKRRVMV